MLFSTVEKGLLACAAGPRLKNVMNLELNLGILVKE
jgi:hypothetical protein